MQGCDKEHLRVKWYHESPHKITRQHTLPLPHSPLHTGREDINVLIARGMVSQYHKVSGYVLD